MGNLDLSAGLHRLNKLLSKNRLLKITLLCIFHLITTDVWANTKNSDSGFMSFNIYPYMKDIDNDNSITITSGAKLQNRFSYFGFINIGNQNDASELEDTETYYTEQNIRWNISESLPIDLTFQMNFRSGENNDRHRLGILWYLHNTAMFNDFFKSIHLSYSINFHAIQFDREDANVWQIEHSFKMTFPYLSDRLYLSGFIDHTFNQDLPDNIPDNPAISEIQLGFRVIDNLYVITEYRLQEYRREDVNNVALGLEYKIKW